MSRPPARIAILSHGTSAFDSRAQRIARTWAARGDTVTLYSRYLAGLPREEQLDGYRLVRIPLDESDARLAARDEAQLNLARTRVLAPIDGIVSRKPTVGAYAAAGTPLLAVVADEGQWVEANFKETDLTRVRPGQTVTIRIDTYPDHVWYGTVGSISQATGAEFALLPPQNASGNWVKVVQRIPVRIRLQASEDAPRLSAGMSAEVTIETGHQRHLSDLW